MRRVVIFGATGKTGLCCTQAAIDLGYDVTVLVRDPSRLPHDLQSRITVKTGDVLDAAAVEDAVQGQDGVIILLGRGNDLSPTTVMSKGTNNILAAMDRCYVRRVAACLSAFNFREKSEVPERFNYIVAEHERMFESLQGSNMEWIAVLPPHITDEDGRGDYLVEHGVSPGQRISKHDLGHFMADCLFSTEHLYQQCGICDNGQT